MKNYKSPDVKAWAYQIQKMSSEYLYANILDIEGIETLKESEKDGWRYAEVWDEPTSVDGTDYNDKVRVADIVANYRFIQYNGNKVALLGCKDRVCTFPLDAPNGSITPDMSGFVYRIIKVTDKGIGSVSNLIDGTPHQVVAITVEGALQIIKQAGKDPVEVMGDMKTIVELIPIMKLFCQTNHLYIQETNQPVDLQGLDALTPDVDEEDLLLSKLS